MAKKKTRIRPIQDRLIVEVLEGDELTEAGLYIPETAKERPQEGRVLAVGAGRIADDGTIIPLSIKAGDRILFGKFSGTETKVDGTEYLIIHEGDVLGVIEEIE